MSDPAANIEIEDVLSSIRRLVSEEGRTGKPAASKTSGKRVGRLVLTPALRVSEPTENAVEDKAAEAPRPPADPAAPWKDPEARLFDAGPVQDTQDEPASEPPPEFRSERTAPVVDDTGHEPPASVVGPLEITDHFEFIDQHSTHVLPPERLPDPERDQKDTEDQHRASDHAETVEARQEPDASGEAERPGPTEPHATQSKSDELASKIEALETAICRSEEEWEPDGSSDEPYSGTRVERLDWSKRDAAGQDTDDLPDGMADPERPATDAQPEAEQVTSARVEPERNDDLLDAGTLDEDALRELVAEIVRQELQGALGERITRNVRKLVRREIHRALSAQSLD